MSQISAQPDLLDQPQRQNLLLTAARAWSSSVAIVAVATGLMAIGTVMSLSAGSARMDGPIVGLKFWEFAAMRQILFVLFGLTAMITMMHVPYTIFTARRGLFAKVMLAFAIILTASLLIPGVGIEKYGAVRWIAVGGGIQFQPSELIKVFMPIFLAVWMGAMCDIRKFRTGFAPTIIVLSVGLAVVGIEDFGTAALIACVGGMMILFAGAKWWHVILPIIPGAFGFAFLLLSNPARIKRVTTFMDIWLDPEDSGYQAIQSLCTIASGGFWGHGLGQGIVKGNLPEARTDFVFSVICEELGAMGAIAIIGLLLILLWQGSRAMSRCTDPTGRLLAFGIILTLGVQAAMNIAVVTVSVPTKGISLPFVSAGGSGAIFLGALTGILANIARIGPLTQPLPEPHNGDGSTT